MRLKVHHPHARLRIKKLSVPLVDREYYVLAFDSPLRFLSQTSCSQAIKNWEAKNETSAEEATVVKLYCQIPPIAKLDNSLNTLKNCE